MKIDSTQNIENSNINQYKDLKLSLQESIKEI